MRSINNVVLAHSLCRLEGSRNRFPHQIGTCLLQDSLAPLISLAILRFMWPLCLEQVNVHMRQIVFAILDRLHTLILEGLDTQDKEPYLNPETHFPSFWGKFEG